MNLLFPAEPAYPPGFTYTPNFLSEQEELYLIKLVQGTALHPFQFQGFEARRRVASFGFDYKFDQKRLVQGESIPAAWQPLIRKVALFLDLDPELFKELLITEYPAGSVINWHRDAPPFDLIAGISLAADCSFRLRPHASSSQRRKSVFDIPVARRSLYQISGEARTAWEHSIKPVMATRYSITLRTLRATT
ncbi:MAG: alpha-ketoglutarate-dependent dioxygenase AlkB [Sphingobacteriales bacterium]|nr:MAG: alpha-ketoglutarate-dependent dioxygenase AlkB [Sphingobacteriales bacterium]